MRTLKLDKKQNETLKAMLNYFYEIKINPKYQDGFIALWDNFQDQGE